MRLAQFLLSCLLLAPPALAEPSASGLYHTADIRLARPLVTNDGAQTRLTFALPPGVTYTLTLGPTGLDLAVQGARVEVDSIKAPGPSISEYRAGSGQVHLRTPFPLSTTLGWRGTETRTDNGLRVLVLEFGPTLAGGATGPLPALIRATTSTPVLSSLPPGDMVLRALPATSTVGAPPGPVAPTPVAARPATALSAPRVQRQDGLTRVVLDLPPGVLPRVTVAGGNLRVALAGVTAPALQAQPNTPEVRGWRYDSAAGSTTLTLVPPTPLRERGGWQAVTRGNQLTIEVSPALADRTPLTGRLATLSPAQALPGAALLTFPAALVRPRVVLDPGHGGNDPGAVGAVTEKMVTLDVALRVQTLLRQAGVDAVLTRGLDRELHADKATDLKLRAGLGTPGTQLFVSIHVNAMPAENALRGYGVETWWNPNHPRSQGLAAVLQKNVVGVTGAFSQGLKSGRSLAVLRESRVPAALVEIGFTSHPVDGLNLQDTHYLDRVAFGIAQGVREALVTGLTAGR